MSFQPECIKFHPNTLSFFSKQALLCIDISLKSAWPYDNRLRWTRYHSIKVVITAPMETLHKIAIINFYVRNFYLN